MAIESVTKGSAPAGINVRVPPQTKFPFYRCAKCYRVITYLQERSAMKSEDENVTACPCGALRYSPTNLVGLEHVLPRVLWFRFLNRLFDY